MRGAYEVVDEEFYLPILSEEGVYDESEAELESMSKEYKRQLNFPLLTCPVCREEWPGFKGDINNRCPWNECGQGQVQQLFYVYIDDELVE